ncbi:MAG: fibronectin type III domain-containing protein [Bacteroidales bacterium]|nr:fibronectin type III domain-containing protein [Bacteroidales bacterium]
MWPGANRYYTFEVNCPAPTQFTASNVTHNSADFSWVEIAGATRWRYTVTPPLPGVTYPRAQSRNPFTLTGLQPNTDYTVCLESRCDPTAYPANSYSEPVCVTFHTDCAPIATSSLPYTENFDSYDTVPNATLGPCLYKYFYDHGTYTRDSFPYPVANPHAGNSGRSMVFYSEGQQITSYLALPTFADPVNTLAVTFDLYRSTMAYLDYGSIQVGVMTDYSDLSTFTPVQVVQIPAAGEWRTYEVPLRAYTGAGRYIALRATAGDSNYVYLDNLSVNIAPTCTAPQDLTVSTLLDNSFILTWTERGTATLWEVEYGSRGFARGTGTRRIVNTTSCQITGLNASTAYDVYVRSICGAGDTSNYNNRTVTTACAPIPHSALPYVEPFDSYPARPLTRIDPCWHTGTSYPSGFPTRVTTTATIPSYNGSYSYQFRGDANNYSYAALPLFADNVSTLMLSFMMRKAPGSNSDNGVVRIGVMSDPTDFNTFQLVQTLSVTSSDWESFDVPLTTYSGSGRYITIASGNTGYGNTYIDNVEVSSAPSCLRPQLTSLRASAVLGNSATITWRQLNRTNMWYVEYGISGAPSYTYRAMSVSTPVAYLTGLTPDTTYTVLVRAICGYGDSSAAVSFNFRTGCTPIPHSQLPFVDGLENYANNPRPTPCWHYGTNQAANSHPKVENRAAITGNRGLTFLASDTLYSYVTLPEIAPPLQNLLVSFQVKRELLPSSSNSSHIYLGVMPDPEDYSTFIRVADINDHTTTAQSYSMMLNRYSGPQGCIAIVSADALRGGALNYTFIDDIRVEPPRCPMPDSLFVSVGDNYADVSWTELGSATRWAVEYGQPGFARGTGTRRVVNDTSYRITGLTPATTYDIYVASICGPRDTSTYRLYTFTTACAEIDSNRMPYTENFEGYTSSDPRQYYTITIPCWHRGYYLPSTGSLVYDASAYYPQIADNAGCNSRKGYVLISGNDGSYSYFTLPLFQLNVNRLMIEFKCKSSVSTSSPLVVGLSPDPYNLANFDTVKVFRNLSMQCQDYMFCIHRHSPQNRYVVFISDRQRTDAGNQTITIDDIRVSPKPTCPGIIDINLVSRSYHNAIITWDDQPDIIDGHPASYELIINNFTGIQRDTFYTSNRYFAFSNLYPNDNYTVNIRANCSSTDNGAWATFQFHTQDNLCHSEIATPTNPTQYLPVNNPANYSLTQQLYRPNDVGGAGYITNIAFYSTAAQSAKTNCVVYMGHTTDTTLDRMLPLSGMQQVYSGPLTTLAAGWDTLILSNPFAYNGSESLVIAVVDNSGVSDPSGANWYSHPAVNMSLSCYNNNSPYNGAPSGTVNRHNFRSNIRFIFNCYTPPCLPPNVYVARVTADTAEIVWGAGNVETAWNVDYRKRGETNWVTAASGTTTRACTIAGLDSSCTYDVRVTSLCSNNSSSSVISRFNTLCRPIRTLPFVENFERYDADTAATLDPCWTKYYVDGATFRQTNYPYPTSDYAYSGSNSLYFFCNGVNRYSYVALPEFGMPGNQLQVSFKAFRSNNENANGYISLGLMSNPDDFSTFRTLQTFHLENSGVWTSFDLDFANTADTNHFIAFVAYATSGNNYIRIDDIMVTPTPTCPRPINFNVFNITDTSATFTFMDRAGASRWSLEYGPAGFTEGTGAVEYITALPATLTTLSPNTHYDVYLRAHCAVDDSSTTTLISFTTECSGLTPADLPYRENFDSYAFGGTASISPCWKKGTNYTSATNLYPYPEQMLRGSDSTNALFFSGSTNNYSYAAMPSYSGNIRDLMVSMKLYKPSTSGRYGYLRIGVMTNPADFNTFQEVATIYAVNAATWENHEVSLAAYTGTGRYIAFASDNISSCLTYVDDIVVDRAPSCMRPYNVYATAVTGNSVSLTWSDNAYSPLGWVVEVGRSGFMPGHGMKLGTTTQSITVNGLAPQTNYDVYVYTRCNGTDTSAASQLYSFTTGCGAIRHSDLPYTETFDSYATGAGASINSCWTKSYYNGLFTSRNYPYPVSTNAYTAPNSFLFYAGDSTYYAYAILPEFEDAVSALQLRFKMQTNDLAEGTLKVGVTNSRSGNAQDFAGFTPVATIACTEADAWQEKTVNFSSYGGTGYIMLLYRPSSSGANVFVDDLVVEPATSCNAPDALYAESQETSATVHWTPAAGSTVTRWLVEYGQQGFLPGMGTRTTVSNDTSYTITQLAAGSFYDVYVSALCGTRDTSPSLLVSFSTQCPALPHSALPYSDDFESYATGTAAGINPCWQRYSNYTTGNYPYATAAVAYAGFQSLAFVADTQHYCYVVLPRFVDTVTSLELSFRLRRSAVGMSGTVVVGVMDVASQRSTFHPYQSCTPAGVGTDFEEVTVDFSAYYATGHQIALMMYEGADNAAFVDNIVVRTIPNCQRPVNIVVTDLQSNQAGLAWDRGTASSWRVEYGRSGFTRGHGIIVNTSSPSISITGLQPSSTYDLYVRSTCSASDTSYFSHITFTTSCAAIAHADLPYSESFEGYGTTYSSIINQCWYKQYFDGTVFTTSGYPHAAVVAYSGSRSLEFRSNTADGTFGYAVLPEFIDSVNQLELSFRMSRATVTSASRIKVGVITNPTDITTFHLVAELCSPQTSSSFDLYNVSFAPYSGPNGRIALLADLDAGDNNLYVDDVVVSAVDICPQPANIVISATSTTASVSWTAIGSTSHWTVEYGPSGFVYGTGTRVTDSTGSVLLTQLQPSTTYDLYIYTLCSSGVNSTPLHTTFTTACAEIATVSLPYIENFDSYVAGVGQSISPCWYRAYYNGTSFITTSYPYPSADCSVVTGGKSLAFYAVSNTTTPSAATYSYAVLPLFESPLSDLSFSFKALRGSEQEPGRLVVGVMSNPTDASSFDTIGFANISQIGQWEEFYFTFDSVPSNKRYIAIFNHGNGMASSLVYVDEVRVRRASPCADIYNLHADAVSMRSIVISWNVSSEANVSSYRLRLIDQSGSDRSFSSNQRNYIFDNLVENSQYTILVAAYCGSNGPWDTLRVRTGYWPCVTEVGTADTSSDVLPVSFNNYYSASQQLYLASEIGTAGTINAIAYYYIGSSPMTAKTNCSIYFMPTSQQSINSFTGLSSAQLVYNGSINATTHGWHRIEFSSPYIYNGTDNILVTVIDNSGDAEGNVSAFRTTLVNGRALYAVSDTGALPSIQRVPVMHSNQLNQVQFVKACTASGCVAPSLAVLSTATDRVSLAWTRGNSESSWRIEYRNADDTVWTTFNPNITQTTATVTGLTAGTDYQFRVLANCTGAQAADTATASTTCSPIASLPYSENFDSYNSAVDARISGCWDKYFFNGATASTNNYPYPTSAFRYGSSGNALRFHASATEYSYAVLPETNVPASSLAVSLKAFATTQGEGRFSIGVITDPADLATYTPCGSFQVSEVNQWQSFSLSLSAAGNGRIAIVAATGAECNLYIDNVVVMLAASCPAPDSLVIASVTSNRATFSWRENGTARQWRVEYGPQGFVPGTGTPTTASTNTNFTLNGLSANTVYDVYIRALCATNSYSAPLAGSLYTDCSAITAADLPYSDNFDSYASSADADINTCWRRGGNVAGGVKPYITTTAASSGANALCFDGSDSRYCYVALPRYDGTVSQVGLSFDLYRPADGLHNGTVLVGVMTDPSDPSTFQLVRTVSALYTGHWETYDVEFASYRGTGRYVAVFANNSSASQASAIVDNMQLRLTPSCTRPTSPVILSASAHSATVSWVQQYGSPSSWQIEYGPTGFTVGSGTIVTSSTTRVNLTGLSADYDYDVYIRAVCGSSSTSEPAYIRLSTQCGTIGHNELPYTENFDAYAAGPTVPISPCWYKVYYTGVSQFNSYPYPTGDVASSGLRSLCFHSTASYYSYVSLPAFEDSLKSLAVNFKLRKTSAANSGKLLVGVVPAPSDYANFVLVDSVAPRPDNISGWQRYAVYLDNYTGPEGFITLLCDRGEDNTLYVDDLNVDVIPSCPQPQHFTATTGADTANLHWTNYNNYSSLVLEYGFRGFQPGTGIRVPLAATDTAATLRNLREGTDYDVYLHAVCSATDSSLDAYAYFTTDYIICPMPIVSTFEDSTDNERWHFSNTLSGNRWVVGSNAHNGGGHGLYVSNNDIVNNYNTDTATAVYAWHTVYLDAPGTYLVNFDWRGVGEGTDDYLRVLLAPMSDPLVAGELYSGLTAVTTPTGWYALDAGQTLSGAQQWQHVDLRAQVNASGNYRIIFAWVNNATGGTQPPAAVDNLLFRRITCFEPTNFQAVSTSANSATLSWTPGANEPQWLIHAVPLSGGYTDLWQTANTNSNFVLTGLMPSTLYEATIYSYCGGSDTSFAGPTIRFTTSCGTLVAPFYENFESYNHGISASLSAPSEYPNHDLIPCADYINMSRSRASFPHVFITSAPQAIDGKSLLFVSNSETTPVYMVLPRFDVRLDSLSIVFQYLNTDTSTGTFTLGYIPSNGTVADFVALRQLPRSATARRLSYNFSNAMLTDTNSRIAIRLVSNNPAAYNFIDNLAVTLGPDCRRVVAINELYAGDSVIALDITSNGGSEWLVEYGASGFTRGSGNFLRTATTSPVISGLSPDMSYDFYVYTLCMTGDTAEHLMATFSTLCSPSATPFAEGFESPQAPHCWLAPSVPGAAWSFRSSLGSVRPHDGSYMACFSASQPDSSAMLISQMVDITSTQNPTLVFWYAMPSAASSDKFNVYYRTTYTSPWTLLDSLTAAVPNQWERVVLSLPSASLRYQIALEGVGANGGGICVDGLWIDTLPYYNIHAVPNDSVRGYISGTGRYSLGQRVTLTAAPNYGYNFQYWPDSINTNPVLSFLADCDTTFSPVCFGLNQYRLTVLSDVDVSNNPLGVVTGTGTYDYLTVVPVTVTPGIGYYFSHWSDGVGTASRSVTLLCDSTITAYYDTIPTFFISVLPNYNDRGTTTGGGAYRENVVFNISATPNYGYHFTSWSDGVTTNPRTVTAVGDSLFVAIFNKDTFSVTVNNLNPDRGTVYGSTTALYLDTVVIGAVQASGYHFSGWTDGDTTNPRVLVLERDSTFTATFDYNYYNITTSSNDNVMGYTLGDTLAAYLDTVQLTAVPRFGYRFVCWNDSVTDSVRFVTVMQHAHYIANFVLDTCHVTTFSADTVMGYTIGDTTAYYFDTVTIEAIARYGYNFARWMDGDTNNPRRVVMMGNITYVAYFYSEGYTLHTATDNSMMGYTSPDTTARYLDTVYLEAYPNYGFHFTHWSDGDTNNPRWLVLTSDTFLTAYFDYNLYHVTGLASDPHMGYVDRDTDDYYLNTVCITAVAGRNYHFLYWSDGDTNNPRCFTLLCDTTFTAVFDYDLLSVVAATQDYSMGRAYGDTLAPYLSEVPLRAEANRGYYFVGWSDGYITNPRTLVVTSDIVIVAMFQPNRYTLSTASADTLLGYTLGDTVAYTASVLTVSATARSGYRFSHWSDGNTRNPRQVILYSDTLFTAHFVPDDYTLLVAIDDTTHGYVAGDTTVPYLGYATAYAYPHYGYHFSHWSDYSVANPHTIQLHGDTTLTAYFVPNDYTVSTIADTMGYAIGDTTAPYLSQVTLTAVPAYGYRFVAWSDGDTNNPRVITLLGDTTLTPTFTEALFHVTVTAADPVMGLGSGNSNNYYRNTHVIMAIANPGYVFTHWQDGDTNNPRTFTVMGDTTFVAYFIGAVYSLTLRANDRTLGSVSGPSRAAHGDNVCLTATPTAGNRFVLWDDGSFNPNRCITVLSDTTVTAIFGGQGIYIAALPDNNAHGYTSGSGLYNLGDTATIMATAAYGYVFTSWSDGDSTNPRRVVATVDTLYTALFTPVDLTLSVSYDSLQGFVSGEGQYPYGTLVTLTAQPYIGYHIAGWDDGSTALVRQYRLLSDTTLRVVFHRNSYVLSALATESTTVAGAPTTVVGSVLRGNGGQLASGNYLHGDSVMLFAQPAYGCQFIGWADGSTLNPRPLVITSDTTVVALFERITHSVVVRTSDANIGTASGTGLFGYGVYDTLVATPAAGCRFLSWDDGDTTNPRVITVIADTVYTALFEAPLYTVNVVAGQGSGSVFGGGTYRATTHLTISALPNTGYHFDYWHDGDTNNPRFITVSADTTYTANFSVSVFTVALHAAYGTVSGAGTYPYGSLVTIAVAPYAGHAFVGWSDGNTTNPRQFRITSNMDLTAIFDAPMAHLDASVNNPAWGSVSGVGFYPVGSMVNIDAVAVRGSHFKHWLDGVHTPSRTITLEGDTVLYPVFAPDTHVIMVSTNTPERGSVYGNGVYVFGTSPVISATANAGYRFLSWDDGNTDNPRVVSADADYRYVASFVTLDYLVTVRSSDINRGSVSGTGVYPYLSSVIISANAMPHYHFTAWNDGNTQASRTVTVLSDVVYTASFEANDYSVTVTPSNASYGSASGSGTYAYGTLATITATPRSGYRFAGWSDGNRDNPRQLLVTGNMQLTAMIEPIYFTVALSTSSAHAGQVVGSGTYSCGQRVTIMAIANQGYRFDGWSDNQTSDTRTFTISSDVMLTAYFSPLTSPLGIDDVAADTTDNLFHVYSVDGQIRIMVSGASEPLAIQVYNNAGQLLQTYNTNADGHADPTATYRYTYTPQASGIYIVKATGRPAKRVVVIK